MIDLIVGKDTIDTMNALGFYLTGLYTDGATTVGTFEMLNSFSTN